VSRDFDLSGRQSHLEEVTNETDKTIAEETEDETWRKACTVWNESQLMQELRARVQALSDPP
jgi:hypothetical protein